MLFEVSRDHPRTQDATSFPELRKGIERCARALQSSTSGSLPPTRPRTPVVRANLTGRSALANRANRRTDAFEAEFLRPLSPGYVSSRPSSARGERTGDGSPSQVKQAHARYKELLNDIEAAMNGGVVPAVVPLHIGEVVVEGLAAHGRRHFELTAQPMQPMNVIVQLSCVDGALLPDLYASTATERPSARNYEFKASKAGELVYNHDFDTDAVDSAALTLHLTVECRESCEFRLKSVVRRIPRRLEPSEARVAMLATKSHASVHKKLETLRKDPQAKKKLDQRVASLNRQRRVREKDFNAMNQAKVQEYSPQRREELAITNAGLQAERCQLALQRREMVQKEMETRILTLVNRDEDRKAARAAETQKFEDEANAMELRHRWLEKLVVISYGIQLFNRSVAAKIEWLEEIRQQRASRTIQFFCIAVLTKRRREALYLNAMRLRCGVTAYARTVMPAMACVAKPKVNWFLSVHSLNRPEVSVVNMIKRYLGWIRLMQRRYRQIRMMRSARVESVLPRFLASELLRPAARGASAEVETSAPPPFTSTNSARSPRARGSVFNPDKLRGSIAPKSRGTLTQGHRNTRLANLPRKSFAAARNTLVGRAPRALATSIEASEPDHPAFVEYIKHGGEPLCDSLRRHVMRRHVTYMSKTLAERTQDWQDRKKKHMSEELQMMGLASTALNQEIGPRPRAIEVSKLRDLYVTTFDKMKAGGFKHFFHDRRRLLKTMWMTWRRKVTYGPDIAASLNRRSTARRSSQAGVHGELSGRMVGGVGDEGLQPNSQRPASGTSRPSSGKSTVVPSERGSPGSGRPASAHHSRPNSANRASSPVPPLSGRPASAQETQVPQSISKNRAISKAFGI